MENSIAWGNYNESGKTLLVDMSGIFTILWINIRIIAIHYVEFCFLDCGHSKKMK